MQLLISLSVVVALALLASSKFFWSLRRTPVGAVMFTGGWLVVGVGLLLGGGLIDLARHDQIILLGPLIHFCLGLVGIMIGLQLRRDVLANIPASLGWLIMWDVLASFLGVGAVLAGLWALWPEPFQAMRVPVRELALLGVFTIGWSAEVRSLRQSAAKRDENEQIIRAGAGLGSIPAVMLYAMFFLWFTTEDDTVSQWTQGLLLTGLDTALRITMHGVLAIAIAGVCGLLSWWLLQLTQNKESNFLVILLGITAVMAGAAQTLGIPVLLVGLLTGAVLTNFPGNVAGRLNRVILEAEQPVAMVLLLVAGLLAKMTGGAGLLLMIVLVLAVRIVIKTLLVGRSVQRITGSNNLLVIRGGSLRQNPLAIAMAVELALFVSSHEEQQFRYAILMAVIVIGLSSDLLALGWRLRYQSKRKAGGEAIVG